MGRLPTPRWPFVDLFEHGGTMTAVVTDELLDAFRTADWDAALARSQAADAIAGRTDGALLAIVSPQKYAEIVAALRGVATLSGVVAEYLELPADRRAGFPATMEAVAQLLRHTDPETVDYDVMDASQGELLVEPTLCEENYRETVGHPMWEEADDGRYPGTQLAPFVMGIIARHRDIGPRPVSDDMLVGGGWFQWARTRPAVLALTRYLDAHVPDDADDLFFADGVVEVMIDLSHGGYEPQDVMDYLAGRGAVVDERGVAALAGLVMDALNDLPRWDSNGWTPRELFEGRDRVSN